MQNKFFKSILTTYLAVICTTISYSKGIELGKINNLILKIEKDK